MKKPKKCFCNTKHRPEFAECAEGVVYIFGSSACERMCIGQMGRCINYRIREHRTSLNNGAGSHLAQHVREGKCTAELKSVLIVERGASKHSGTR